MNPWLYIGIAIGTLVLLLIGAIVICFFISRKRTVECPICANIWHPKFFAMLFSLSDFKGQLIKCPHCKKNVPVKYLTKKELESKKLCDDWANDDSN